MNGSGIYHAKYHADQRQRDTERSHLYAGYKKISRGITNAKRQHKQSVTTSFQQKAWEIEVQGGCNMTSVLGRSLFGEQNLKGVMKGYYTDRSGELGWR